MAESEPNEVESGVMTPYDFNDWLENLTAVYNSLPDDKRNTVLSTLIDSSGPSQLLILSSRIPQLVFRDFITGLPPELTLLILQHLDGQQLVLCCRVCKAWNKLISNINGLWRPLAEKAGANVAAYEESLKCCAEDETLDGSISESALGSLHKSLYMKAVSTMRGLTTGKALHLQNCYIDKGQWRITSVKYHEGTVVTGCDDHTVQMWSVPDGSPICSVSTHSVCCLAVRGPHLYTASFNANAESWDLQTGKHVQTFCGHTSAVLAIDVTQDQTFLLTGSVDRTAKLWNLRSPNIKLMRTIQSIHEDWVFQVKFLPSPPGMLRFITCDATLCNLWQTNEKGDVLFSQHIQSDGSSKFTSFYHLPGDPHQMFACQWEEWSKSSWLTKYHMDPTICSMEKDYHVLIPMETVKAYILGAGQKFAVIMCSISRKDFHIIDLDSKQVLSKITTPDFCMLTRNGSTVTLCNTSWLDGFVFEDLTENNPLFAASVGHNTVLLGTWAINKRQPINSYFDSEV